jgi:hypothetical protein
MAGNGMLYGLVGALGVAVVGGGLYIANDKGAFNNTPAPVVATAPAPAPVPAATPPAPAPRPPVVTPAAPAGPSAAQVQQLSTLVLDARRAITRGDFNSADRALDQAERIDPHSSDVIAARRDLRDAQQHAQRQNNQQERRVEALVAEARAAILRHDYVTADRLLDQAEGIEPRDRQVQQARAELNSANPPRRR